MSSPTPSPAPRASIAKRSARRIAATDLPTFYGPIKFDASGKNIAKPMVLTQIVDGEYVVVVPEEWAAAKPIIPRLSH